jgi:hypothetical protein
VEVAAWVGVVAFALYAGAAFWTRTDAAFAGKLGSDNAVSIWFYGYVSQTVGDGRWPQWLGDFNHPNPYPRVKEFPAVMDAVLAAPLGWVFDFPRSWNGTLGLAILVNGVGTALLARGAGARGVGVLVAGCLGALCRPVWKDLVMARMNAVWPGIPAASLGLLLLSMQLEGDGWRPVLKRLPWAVGAGLLGALAATAYPPYLLLFGPLAIALLVRPVVETRGRAVVPMVVGLAAGGLVAWPELMAILESRQGIGDFAPQGCPDRYGALVADALWGTRPEASQGLSLPGAARFGWVLAPLVLLHRRRWGGLVVLAGTALWALLSLGPCPQLREGLSFAPQAWPVVGGLLPPLWRLGAPLHDFGRFATVAVLQAAVLGGLGVSAVAHGALRLPGPRRAGVVGRVVVALALGGAVVGQVQYYVLSESLSPAKWHDVSVPATAAHTLSQPEAERFPIVELPFDRRLQFVSAIYAPGPRLNPLRPGDPPPSPDPFVGWLMQLGRGQTPGSAPTAAQARASGFRRVYLDSDRCHGGGVPRDACGVGVQSALTSVLGAPERVGAGLWVWTVGDGPDVTPPAAPSDR